VEGKQEVIVLKKKSVKYGLRLHYTENKMRNRKNPKLSNFEDVRFGGEEEKEDAWSAF